MLFEKVNANPKGWKTNDCVIRSLALATDYSWGEVYEVLTQKGLKKCRMPNDKIIYEEFLEEEGFIKHKQPRKSDNTKYTVKEWAELNPNIQMIVSVAKHLTYVENNIMMDTWNCSRKSVGNYWTKKK
jgi:hypothetical protein